MAAHDDHRSATGGVGLQPGNPGRRPSIFLRNKYAAKRRPAPRGEDGPLRFGGSVRDQPLIVVDPLEVPYRDRGRRGAGQRAVRSRVDLGCGKSKSHVVGDPNSRAVAQLWLECGADLL